MGTITIRCEETETSVTLEFDTGEDDSEFSIVSTSENLTTPQQTSAFLRRWALDLEQNEFEKAPQALQHVLTVIKFWGRRIYTRIEATHHAAKEQGVTFHTIQDAYTRRLGGRHAADFERLLNGDPQALQHVLDSQYPEHFMVIESYMNYLA